MAWIFARSAQCLPQSTAKIIVTPVLSISLTSIMLLGHGGFAQAHQDSHSSFQVDPAGHVSDPAKPNLADQLGSIALVGIALLGLGSFFATQIISQKKAK